MIRISIHLMDDPADVLASETEHDLITCDRDGEAIEPYAMVGGVKLPVAIEPKVLDAWFAKANAEALVP